MKPAYILFLFAAQLTSSVAFASQHTVVLDVSGMTCPVCPITVKKALEHVNGVTQAQVKLETHQAMVRYDDKKTNENALLDATFEAGYPAKIIRRQP